MFSKVKYYHQFYPFCFSISFNYDSPNVRDNKFPIICLSYQRISFKYKRFGYRRPVQDCQHQTYLQYLKNKLHNLSEAKASNDIFQQSISVKLKIFNLQNLWDYSLFYFKEAFQLYFTNSHIYHYISKHRYDFFINNFNCCLSKKVLVIQGAHLSVDTGHKSQKQEEVTLKYTIKKYFDRQFFHIL